MSYSYLKQLKNFKRIKSVFKWRKTSEFILSPCYLLINLHPMFILRYQKSRDNLSSSDVTLSSRMTDHIKKLSRSCFFQLRQLRTIRRSLSKEATRLLLHAFVVSRLYYCNALFTGLPSKSIGNLQGIQNARIFGGLGKYDHVTSTMKTELHWLRIPERISFKLSTLVYKALRVSEGTVHSGERQFPSVQPQVCKPRRSVCSENSHGDIWQASLQRGWPCYLEQSPSWDSSIGDLNCL